MSRDFVELRLRRNRGWPWPEASWGLDSMYGTDGWCRECGTPTRAQTGPLVLQNKGRDITGAWVPNWRFDSFCASTTVLQSAGLLGIETRPLEWRGLSTATPAVQIVPAVSANDWANPEELRNASTRLYSDAGERCESCGTWRWKPLNPPDIPEIRLRADVAQRDVIASPEWFGSGARSFRQVIFRRDVGHTLRQLSPRDFDVIDLHNVHVMEPPSHRPSGSSDDSHRRAEGYPNGQAY